MGAAAMVRLARGLTPVVLLAASIVRGAAGQEVSLAERAPQFLVVSPGRAGPVQVGASSSALLRRVVSLQVGEPTVGRLLAAIELQTGLRFGYSRDVVQTDRVVTLRADSITVGAALLSILMDTGVDVLLSPDGKVALVERAKGAPAAPAPGAVTGRVTDAKTGEALAGAEVFLEGTRWHTVTADDGLYRLADVAAGSYTLAVRRIGYARRTQAVKVVAEEEVTVDIALEPVPTQLDEIVTTATGEQRRRELGHVVGRINADSLVKVAPVSNLSELLNGRVPGLQVFTGQGTVGGAVSLQLRTPNSVFLSSEPIVIVDGIRYTSGTNFDAGPFNPEPTSRLNDLNPNNIESIEVVKGPSAATLYGTDASNGVIVITTKRGQPGPARWSAYGKASGAGIPTIRYPDTWWGWGSATSSCRLVDVAAGACTQDSVTALPNPLNDPDLTIFATKPRYEYGLNVSGGREELRYYFSGDFERAIGPVQMPPAAAALIKEQRGVQALPDEQENPNATANANLRLNVSTKLADRLELQVNSGYVHGATRTLGLVTGPYNGGAPSSMPGEPYGSSGSGPVDYFSLTSTETIDRFFTGATAYWRPGDWITAHATVGLDLANGHRASLGRRGEGYFAGDGQVGDIRSKGLATTADLGLTAVLRRGRLSFRNAVGAQYVRNLSDQTASSGFGLPPGGESIAQALTRSSTQSYSESVTLGSYLEETVGLNDRLFLTGALRVDGASAFGRDYNAAAYPKASASWLASEEPFFPRIPGLDELRLRYAFGVSGQQAMPGMALPTFSPLQGLIDGQIVNAIELSGLGSPNLRPERVREHEWGIDLTSLAGRVQLGLTWFERRTRDQIVSQRRAPGLMNGFFNLGLTRAHGFEAELRARLIDTRPISWDMAYQYSLRRSKLEDLGDMAPLMTYGGSYAEGYPIGGRFEKQIVGYADANGDGLIGQDEVQLTSLPVYVGEGTPARSQTLTAMVGFLQRQVRISALLERRSDYVQVSWSKSVQCSTGACRAAVDPTTPLADQAAATAISLGVAAIEPGSFTRLREVTAAVDLPRQWLRAMRLGSATLSLAARNVALWTEFDGPDPESAFVSGPTSGVANGIPQGRSWTLRLDLGL